jgi:hypothetical protein
MDIIYYKIHFVSSRDYLYCRYVLTIVDYMSKWPEAYTIFTKSAQEVASKIEDTFYRFSVCQVNIYSGFFCEILSASLFHLGILWDKNHIKIFCSEIWVEIIFGWPTFKIMCNTPIFYFDLRCQIENQVSDYRHLGASSLVGCDVQMKCFY